MDRLKAEITSLFHARMDGPPPEEIRRNPQTPSPSPAAGGRGLTCLFPKV